MFKKTVSVFLAIIFVLSLSVTAFASASESAKLYNVYANGMLFAQNKEAVLYGTAPENSNITATLIDANGETVTTGNAVAKDGKFSVSFMSPKGSFSEYTVVLTCNGNEFARLLNVVFGELWLASGQSNMQYPLSQDKYGAEMMASSQKLSKWLRVLLVPPYPPEKLVPSTPIDNITNVSWINGESSSVYGMSAVAYFFADKLMNELQMPVGILNASLGGSSIGTWISREAIDSDEKVKNAYIDSDSYVPLSEWDEKEQNIYSDMTANYNSKIYALRFFRPSGMIWYQGESDMSWTAQRYSDALDLLQSSYTDLFEYEDGLFPIIYTHLASFYYSKNGLDLIDRNMAFTDMQVSKKDSRAVVSIYDIPLTYIDSVGAIHPEHKKEIGERMAFSAQGLVYGSRTDYSVPSVVSSEIKDGAVYVTFDSVGDTLVSVGDTLNGFAVCGSDGIYVKADAVIVDKDTVKVSCDSVKAPKSASYAYCINNLRSNLYASENGVPTLPVSQFITDRNASKHYWFEKTWADCEDDEIWHTYKKDYGSRFYDSWESKNADISFGKDSAFSGVNGLKVTANNNKKSFSVNPVLNFKHEFETLLFTDYDADYSDFGTMSFYVRNNGSSAVTLDAVRFYINAVTWFAPEVLNTDDPSTIIPADGKWHLVTLDLNSLYLHGNEGGAVFSRNVIDWVRDIKLCFNKDSDASADISIDHFRFTSTTEKASMHFNMNVRNADTFFEVILAMITGMFARFISLFK